MSLISLLRRLWAPSTEVDPHVEAVIKGAAAEANKLSDTLDRIATKAKVENRDPLAMFVQEIKGSRVRRHILRRGDIC